MIRSFKDKEAEKIFNRQRSSKFPEILQRVALRKLRMLNRAASLNDLRVPPANRPEKLKGGRLGQHSIPRCCIKFGAWIYPVRNNPPLGFESQRLEFLTG
jgi:proteic killer suppression protein